MSSPAADDDEALRYGRYNVLRREDGTPWELGRGGMGVTYKAEDPELRRAVVLKVILPALFGNDPQARARFRREARAAAGVHHPHIATIFDIGEARGEDYYVMEFIAGEDLLSRLKREGPMDVLTALRVGRQVAEALDAAWEPRRIVHRDLKPANLMLARRPAGVGREAREGPLIKVVDFGLAKALEVSTEASGIQSRTGVAVGTWAYASPEQLDASEEVGPPSDFYSLGVTLWEALLGKPTFGHPSNYRQALAWHFNRPPPFEDLRAIGVPEPLLDFLARLLAKEACDRPGNATAVAEEIEGLLQTLAPSASPPGQTPAAAPSAGAFHPEDSFTLVEALRQRGVLPANEVVRLLEALAPLVDAAWAGDDPPMGVSPGCIRIRFDPPPPAEVLRALPGRPLDDWPPCVVDLDAWEQADPGGVDDAAPTSLGQTLSTPRGRVAVTAAGVLAALGYELLGGQPPPPGPWRPLPALNEAGNATLREALNPDTRFRSAAELGIAVRASAKDVADPVVVPPARREVALVVHRPPPPRGRPRRYAAVLLGFVSVGVASALFLKGRGPGPDAARPLPPEPASPTPTREPAEPPAPSPSATPAPKPTPTPTSTPLRIPTQAPKPTPNPVPTIGSAASPTPAPGPTATPPPTLSPSVKQAIQLVGEGRVAHNDGDQGDYPRAIALFTRAIELNPTDALAYVHRGKAYEALRQFERAISDYDKAIGLDPKLDGAYAQRGSAYGYNLNRHQVAITDCTKAIELNPLNTLAYSTRSSSYRALKQYERALADANRAIEISPTGAYGYFVRARAYVGFNQPERAIEDFDKAIALGRRGDYYFRGRADTYLDLKQFERAVADYTKAIELNPNGSSAYFGRGVAYRALGQEAQALRDFAKASELSRPRPPALPAPGTSPAPSPRRTP